MESHTPQKRPLPPSPSTNLHLEERIRRKANPSPKGLQNLGNTCFMNSALQCLAFTAPLTSYFLSGAWKDEVNHSNPLGMEGRIPTEYANLIANLWFDDESTSYSPRSFKLMIGERNPTFVGYGQQDSQELFQSLLDGLHEDLNRIHKRDYVEDPDYNSEKMTEEEFARICWSSYKKRNDSIIVDLFQGQLKSKTECQNCHHISIKFDPYMYLQLPIPEPEFSTVEVVVCDNLDFDNTAKALYNSRTSSQYGPSVEDSNNNHLKLQEKLTKELKFCRPRNITVKVPRHCSISNFKLAVAKKAGWTDVYCLNPELSFCADVFNCEIYKIFDNSLSISSFAQNDKICVYQVSLTEYSTLSGAQTEALEPASITPIPALLHLQSSGNNMGFPAIVSLPEKYSIDPSSSQNLESILGPLLYRVAVVAISRFSIIPLFRKVKSGLKRSDLDDWITHRADLSFYALSEDWEPIPDLFVLQESGNIIYDPDAYACGSSKQSELLAVDGTVSSPKSEVSDLVHNFHNYFDTPPKVADIPPMSNAHQETAAFNFGRNSKLTLSLGPSTAFLLFGEDPALQTPSYISAPSIFAPMPNPEPAEDYAEKSITLDQCMDEFTKVELLDGADTMYCSKCKKHQPTKKQLSVFTVPEVLQHLQQILVIHLKRFSNSGRYSSRSKLDNFVDAPVTDLDISVMIGDRIGNCTYDLYAVSNHFGGLGGGHYTAYTFNPLDQKWYNCDDSHVSEVSGNVVTKAAYLLLYRKRYSSNVDLKAVIINANEKRREEIERKASHSIDPLPSYHSIGVDIPVIPSLSSSSPIIHDNVPNTNEYHKIPSEAGTETETAINSPSIVSEITPPQSKTAEEFDAEKGDHYILEYP